MSDLEFYYGGGCATIFLRVVYIFLSRGGAAATKGGNLLSLLGLCGYITLWISRVYLARLVGCF